MIISKYKLIDIQYLVTKKIGLMIWGSMRRNLVKVFYVKWSNNFGDLLTPMILKYYGLTPVFSYPYKTQCTVIGTILELMPSTFNGYILGSGWTNYKYGDFPDAKILGVRGFLTKEYLGIKDSVCIGDPGLLISRIYPCLKSTKFKLGIIPHESEICNPLIKKLKRNIGKDCIIISPRNKDPKKILRAINSCEYIVSSSLHGLIVSDSYGIPNGRIKFSELDSSKDFKFHDYYSSLSESLRTYQIRGTESMDQLIGITRQPNATKISQLSDNIEMMFKRFISSFFNK